MSERDPYLSPRFRSQWAVVTEAARHEGMELDYATAYDALADRWVPDCFFEADTLLVASDLVNLAVANTNNAGTVEQDRTIHGRRAESDIAVLKIRGKRVHDAVQRLREIPDVSKARGRITPNHVISICQGSVTICPASEPAPARHLPIPPPTAGHAGAGVRVDVVDTGVWDGFRDAGYPWFADVPVSTPSPGKREVSSVTGSPEVAHPIPVPWTGDPLGPPGIREYLGHGVFVAGVLRCVAPGVDVRVSNALRFAGAHLEDQLGRDLVAGLRGVDDTTHIINLSAGGTAFLDEQFQGLLAFLDELAADGCTTLVVAAAGNDGKDHKFFPAAFSHHPSGAVLSVGALRQDRRAERASATTASGWTSSPLASASSMPSPLASTSTSTRNPSPRPASQPATTSYPTVIDTTARASMPRPTIPRWTSMVTRCGAERHSPRRTWPA